MKNAGLDWLSNLKLRAGWGQTGNEELKDEEAYLTVPSYAYDKYMFETPFIQPLKKVVMQTKNSNARQ